MQDLRQLQKELERQGKLDAVRELSDTPEADALRQRLNAGDLKDPALARAALERLLKSSEGQALAQKIREAMDHG